MELEARMAEASELGDAGHWQEAFELLAAEEEANPEHPVLLCMLGVASRELGIEGQAYDYFRRCVHAEPSDPLVLVTAGTGLASLDDPEAESVLRLAALTAPNLVEARLSYGAYLAREGLTEQALDELRAARELDPSDAEVRSELGATHLRAGDSALGVEELGEAVALLPEDAWTRVLYALALQQAERGDEAAEELYRASLDDESDGEAQVLAALACAAQGWEDEAWNALARAAEAASAPAPALLHEAEEAVEEGADAAAELLAAEVAPSMLRERLFAAR
jgi:Flp pilus assembly protein TadD